MRGMVGIFFLHSELLLYARLGQVKGPRFRKCTSARFGDQFCWAMLDISQSDLILCMIYINQMYPGSAGYLKHWN